MGCIPDQSLSYCTKRNNNQCTNFPLFDVALYLPLHFKGLMLACGYVKPWSVGSWGYMSLFICHIHSECVTFNLNSVYPYTFRITLSVVHVPYVLFYVDMLWLR